jgi:threonine synthase
MDILISSNLERLLYFVAGSGVVVNCMKSLADTGAYSIAEDVLERINSDFCGYYADEPATTETIGNVYENHGYLCDPHTAVGMHCADLYMDSHNSNNLVVLSTASPYKFASSVYNALTKCKAPEGYEALTALSDLTSTPISTPLAGLDKRTVRFERVCDPEQMAEDMFEHLND